MTEFLFLNRRGFVQFQEDRASTARQGVYKLFQMTLLQAHVSMTIVSRAGAVASVIKNKAPVCQRRESDLAAVQQLGELPVSPVTRARQVVKGQQDCPRELGLQCTSHAFQLVHLHSSL